MSATTAAALETCVDLVRRYDHERYLIALFARPQARDDLLVLLAANHEVAKTADMVSEATIGLIRLQWWREAFDGIEAGAPRQHDVVAALASLHNRHPAVLTTLRRIVDAREADLEPEPFVDLDAFERYARETGGRLTAAMATLLGDDEQKAEAIGTAWALIGLVRAVPFTLAGGRVTLPKSLLEENGLTYSKYRDRFDSVALEPVCVPIVARAWDLLADHQGRDDRGTSIPLRLLAGRAAALASFLERTGTDPRNPAVQSAPTALVWRHALRALLYRLGG